MNFQTTERGVILIVDDMPINLEMLLDFLENSGLKVLVAEDGESAVEMAEYAAPDLILLDVLMPGINGFETCRRLKTNEATQDIPIIFMTALTDKVDKIKGLNLGAVDYITKPLEHEEVLARVNVHLHLRHLTKRLIEQNQRLEQEICDRKRAEAEREQAFSALQQSEARFRRLVDSNIIGVIFGDLDGNIKEANDAFLQMVGYDRAELQAGQLDWNVLTPPEYQYLDDKAIAELVSSGKCIPFEKEYIRKDGSRIPVMVGRALLEEFQPHMVGFVLDLTAGKQAEQKIREQAALLDIATDAILVQDLDNQIRFWNKGAERLYKWQASEAIGQNANEILYQPERLAQLQKSWKSLNELGSWQGELHQIGKDGKEIVVASRWTLVRDRKGQPKSLLTVNTDITEKKQLETQFFRIQRLESIGTLASGIAHDINNALTPMLMTVQLLELKLNDPQSKQWISILRTNIKRSADLVKQVLSFARGLEGERTPLQINDLIAEVEHIVQQTFSKAIEICTDVPTSELWTISGNATQLHQVLMNLCVNARDAMPEGGKLQISARNFWVDENYARMNIEAQVGAYVAIAVTDTGVGMRHEVIERVFEPFFTTKEVGKGTGLGLSTVLGIVKSHGGFVRVSSHIGKGSQFQVYLPALKTKETTTSPAVSQDLPVGQGELILVVDDEQSICEITKTSLETYGYQVLVAHDGIEAIALYTQYQDKINAVLMDMMMPSMDGPTTIKVLQKINPDVKIIGVSGLVLTPQTAEFLGNSIKTFLLKPYTSDELLKNLQLVLQAS